MPGGPFSQPTIRAWPGCNSSHFPTTDWEIFFTYYSGRGQEIGRAELRGLPVGLPAEITVTSGIPEAAALRCHAALASIRPYRFWRDLLPRWWSPAWRSGGDEIQAGIITGGQDALGIHSYSLEGYYGFSSRRANIAVPLCLRRAVPDPVARLQRQHRIFSRCMRTSRRSQELKLASLWPLRLRKRSQLYAYADLHLERRSDH